MPLFVETGRFEINHRRRPGAGLIVVPRLSTNEVHGIFLVVAVDITNVENGMAARESVKILSDSYYAAPADWGAKHALNESFCAVNETLCSGIKSGQAVALSALVLRRRRWSLGHAGNNRVWLLRNNELKLLTYDHVAMGSGQQRISNACGLSQSFAIDLAGGELREGDVFALTSSGVHDHIDSAAIMGCLLADTSPQIIAENLTQRAHAAGKQDPVCVCIVRVEKLPRESLADREEDIRQLPIIAPPAVGITVDGFHVRSMLHRANHYRLYQAMDNETKKTVVLKFPNPKYGGDPAFAERFLREEWVIKRLNSPHLLMVLPLRANRRTALYSVLAYEPGENLSDRLRHKGKLSVRESLQHAQQLLKAVEQLHANGIVHGDLRPKNIHVDTKNKRLFLLTPGMSLTAPTHTNKQTGLTPAGNRSYLAPELIDGSPGTLAADIYAVGIIIYRLLTGKYPYGRTGSEHQRDWKKYTSPTRYRRDIPKRLAEALKTACAVNATERFSSAADFSQALTESGRRKSQRINTALKAAVPREFYLAMLLVAGLLVYLAFVLL